MLENSIMKKYLTWVFSKSAYSRVKVKALSCFWEESQCNSFHLNTITNKNVGIVFFKKRVGIDALFFIVLIKTVLLY
jgi:hypothetical protein